MSDMSQGPGWWIASDGKWYPPELHPDRITVVGGRVGTVAGTGPGTGSGSGTTRAADATRAPSRRWCRTSSGRRSGSAERQTEPNPTRCRPGLRHDGWGRAFRPSMPGVTRRSDDPPATRPASRWSPPPPMPPVGAQVEAPVPTTPIRVSETRSKGLLGARRCASSWHWPSPPWSSLSSVALPRSRRFRRGRTTATIVSSPSSGGPALVSRARSPAGTLTGTVANGTGSNGGVSALAVGERLVTYRGALGHRPTTSTCRSSNVTNPAQLEGGQLFQRDRHLRGTNR